jgi:hypothetical protein
MNSNQMVVDFSSIVQEDDTTLLDKVKNILTDEALVFAKYIPNFKLGKLINSPLRDDKSPSFSVYRARRTGKVIYKDFSTGERGDCFNFVQLLFGIDFKSALKVIYRDLNLKNFELPKGTISPNISQDTITQRSTPFEIIVTSQPYTYVDLAYWENYGISIRTLSYFGVLSCKSVIIDKRFSPTFYKLSDPIYAFPASKFAFGPTVQYKIYRPHAAKSDKWRSNCVSSTILGLNKIFCSENIGKPDLFITKSMKDVMVLYELGYVAIAPQSENIVLEGLAIDAIRSKFNNIYVLFDYDNTGITGAQKYKAKYGFYTLFIKDPVAKDISDYVFEYGKQATSTLLKVLMEGAKKYENLIGQN